MANTKIEAYEANDLVVVVTVTGVSDLLGYTSTMTVKEKKGDTTAVFTNTPGAIEALVVTHTVTNTQNDIDRGSYYYEVTITNGTLQYTIAQGIYKIIESIVFHITGS